MRESDKLAKHILITGSTDGIGKLAAKSLAQSGHKVMLHGRNPDKVHSTVAELKATTGNQDIRGIVADFSELRQVRAIASEIQQTGTTLNVLINNAGVYKAASAQTANGLDVRFAVNYFAPVLLTQELLPLLAASEGARVINLSSAAQTTVSLKALVGERKLSTQDAYAQSKLAITMWSFYLAAEWPKVNVIAVNPGSLLNTKMVQEAFGHHWSSADKGATVLHELAVSSEYQDSSGQYFDNDQGKFGPAHQDAYDQVKITELMEATISFLQSD